MIRDGQLHEDLIPLLVNRLGASTYLELGCYALATIGRVQKTAQNCRCIGVDKEKFDIDYTGIEFFNCTTDEFFANHADGIEPDFVFIDADHSATSVALDWQSSWKILKPEGLVLLHDTNPETKADTASNLCGDAWKTAERMSHSSMEMLTLPYSPGLTIIRNRVKWGPQK